MLTLPSRYVSMPINPGRGGMSHAQVCRDIHLDRPVLIKELHADVDQRRLLDEVAALGSIRSKHVVQLYDVIRDEDDEIVGLVEEFLPGSDLNAIIPIADADQYLKIIYAIACGISDIHASGHVHRDIKPGNMKFDAENCLKIFDFGLARDEQADAATQGAVGTLGYMAPELCVDDDEDVAFTQAVDTYAFAATALKLTRGQLPAPMRRNVPTITADADFSRQAVSLSSDLAKILNSCLAADPKDRPTMAAVRDLLKAHLVRDRHRAILVESGNVHVLSSSRRSVIITLRLGKMTLAYDGLHFRVSAASGAVFVNNIQVNVPHVLPGSCVLTFGGPEAGNRRTHMTLDVSHPEVVL